MSAEETGLLGLAHLLAQLSCLCAVLSRDGYHAHKCITRCGGMYVNRRKLSCHTHTNKPPQVGLGKFEALQQELATRDFAKGCRYHLHAVRIVFVLHWTSVGYYVFS